MIGPLALSRLHAYAAAAPEGNFLLFDMGSMNNGISSQHGSWQDWGGAWGVPFIWTALHTFGGNDGIRGNLSEINEIPFAAPPFSPPPATADPRTRAVGVGYTPEGLDQNPAYYELLQEAAFKSAPERNLTDWLVRRAHRRYGLLPAVRGAVRGGGINGGGGSSVNPDVASAWGGLAKSGYANDGAVHEYVIHTCIR
jgi:hypothetical protein